MRLLRNLLNHRAPPAHDTGSEFVDGMVDVGGVADRGELMGQCTLKPHLLGLAQS